MSTRARVEFTSPESDRVGRLALTATALIAAALGVAVAYLWRDAPRSDRASPAEQSASQHPRANAAPEEQLPRPEPPSDAALVVEPTGRAATHAPIAESPESAAPARRSPVAPVAANAPSPQRAPTVEPRLTRHLDLGLVAYVRCDGVPQHKGPFPCPRDRGFERSVWRALRGLETCAQAATAHGTADVRIAFSMHESPQLRILPGVSGPLDPKIVNTCVGEALSATRTMLAPERMVVSFRFGLR